MQDEEPSESQVAPIKKEEGGISRGRNHSLISKKSVGDSAPQLSRVGSVNAPISKQESTVSTMSQGSTGTGVYQNWMSDSYLVPICTFLPWLVVGSSLY